MNNPKDEDVNNALKEIEGVTKTCMITEENDPNGNLNKKGGYTGAIYFRLSQVDDAIKEEEYSTPLGNDACEVGTTGGGQIEIYANKKDAEARLKYLDALNHIGGIEYQTTEGTLVIRISEKLTSKQQKDIASKIINKLSKEN